MKAGDTVYHRPSKETWIISAMSPDNKELCPAGWPESIAKVSDCELKESCFLQESLKMTLNCSMNTEGYPRGSWARETKRIILETLK